MSPPPPFELHKAAASGNVCLMLTLLETDTRMINRKDNKDFAPLHQAASHGHVEAATVLINHGAIVDIKGWAKSTPLHIATAHGHWEIVWLLLERGASIEAKDDQRFTALHIASKYGNDHVAHLLLNRGGANVVAIAKDGVTPLHLAATSCNWDTVDVLLDGGAPIDQKDTNGRTPFHIGCEFENECSCCGTGNLETLRHFLDRGADIEAANKDGETPLLAACSRDRLDVVCLLLQCGADIGINSRTGISPLHHVARCTGNHEIAMLLLQYGANMEAKDRDSAQTPLHSACQGICQGCGRNLLEVLVFCLIEVQTSKRRPCTNSLHWAPHANSVS